jgi:hypothetical protein
MLFSSKMTVIAALEKYTNREKVHTTDFETAFCRWDE